MSFCVAYLHPLVHPRLSLIQLTSTVSTSCLKLFIFKLALGCLSNLPHIKSMSSNLAESCYLLRWPLPMANPEHPLTHLLHGELWTWGPAWSDGKTSPARWSESPVGTSCFFPSLLCFITIFDVLSSLSSAVDRWLQAAHIRECDESGREVIDGAATDMGKGRINNTKNGEVFISVLKWTWKIYLSFLI